MLIPQSEIISNMARLIFLALLVPADGHWEPALSLALDGAVLAVESGA